MRRKEMEAEIAKRTHSSLLRVELILQAMEDVVVEAIADEDSCYFRFGKIGGTHVPPVRNHWAGRIEDNFDNLFPGRIGYPYVQFAPSVKGTNMPYKEYFEKYPDELTPTWRFNLLAKRRYHNVQLSRRLTWTLMAIIDRRWWVDHWDARMRLMLDKLKTVELREKWGAVINNVEAEEKRRTTLMGYRFDRHCARKFWIRECFNQWQEDILYGKWPNDQDSFLKYIDEKTLKDFPDEENTFARNRMEDKKYVDSIMNFEDSYKYAVPEVDNAREAGFHWQKNYEIVYDPPTIDKMQENDIILERLKKIGVSDEEVEEELTQGLQIDEIYYNHLIGSDYLSSTANDDELMSKIEKDYGEEALEEEDQETKQEDEDFETEWRKQIKEAYEAQVAEIQKAEKETHVNAGKKGWETRRKRDEASQGDGDSNG